jgi:hypothetical protein
MKQLITDKEVQAMIEDILKTFPLNTLLEAPGQPMQQAPIAQQKQIAKPVVKAPAKRVVKTPVQHPPTRMTRNVQQKPVAKPKPTSQTIPGAANKPEVKKAYDPVRAKEKQQMNKTQYQIFNIKNRLGKIGLNDTVRRFAQSIHDFDNNVTKNSSDENDIRSYFSIAQGNLVALKGALESLEAEFNELERLLNEE